MQFELNENQIKATEHFKGPMMVLAGPGSGKTTVITYRILNLVKNHNITPSDILVITFTKAAAEEMKTRFEKLSPESQGISFGTFHSFFFRVIRKGLGFGLESVLSENERQELIRNAIKKLAFEREDEDDLVKMILTEISLVKNELIDIKFYNSPNIAADDFRNLFAAYEKEKHRLNKIDFDDMLVKCYELLTSNSMELEYWRHRYSFILIDEFQDINRVQYECIKLLAQPLNNLFIVGDDDQSIFKFRGASPGFLLRFPADFEQAKKIVLDVNYRSSERIISLCSKLISQNKRRYDKNIHGVKKESGALKLIKSEDIRSEAVKIGNIIKNIESKTNYDEIAVIFRTNIQARAFVDAFRDLNIPYQLKDQIPIIYEHWIARDICSYMRLALDRNLSEEMARIINRPKRYISKAELQKARKGANGLLANLFGSSTLQFWQKNKLEELMFYLNSIKSRNPYEAFRYIRKAVGYESYLTEYAEYRKMNPDGLFEVLDELMESTKGYEKIEGYLEHVTLAIQERRQQAGIKKQSGVTLSTMHSAKGLEFETVFVVGVVEGVVPHERSKAESDIEEECRLLYVAISRAKNNLYISQTHSRYDNQVKPSRFFNVIKS